MRRLFLKKNILISVVLCNFAETFMVISKKENTLYISRCAKVQVNIKSDGNEFKKKKFNLRRHKKGQVGL